jgi:hypothetical protein
VLSPVYHVPSQESSYLGPKFVSWFLVSFVVSLGFMFVLFSQVVNAVLRLWVPPLNVHVGGDGKIMMHSLSGSGIWFRLKLGREIYLGCYSVRVRLTKYFQLSIPKMPVSPLSEFRISINRRLNIFAR